MAARLDFDISEQTRIATAVSEIGRNALRYTGGGVVHFDVDREARPQSFIVHGEDRGCGIPHLNDVLAGRYTSVPIPASAVRLTSAVTRQPSRRFSVYSPAGVGHDSYTVMPASANRRRHGY